MATLVLAAAGAAIGGAFGSGTVLGLTGAVIGRAVGATLGQVIDQRLLGSGSEPVRSGQVDRFRVMGASEGGPIPRVWGRARVGGQVIWASRFLETVTTRGGGGGKGTPRQPQVEEFTYSVSLAVALCEGPIQHVGRVWADGMEIDPADYTMHVYRGDEAQVADPKIAAIEGAGNAPAYRGLAYVLFEDLPLGPFGNRVPQFSFEVIRGAVTAETENALTLGSLLSSVALIPGTGEYSLSTEVVRLPDGPGRSIAVNGNSPRRGADFPVALGQLRDEVPNLRSVSVVVSWFGNDLRCGLCSLRPKVERADRAGVTQVWCAGGLTRAEAQVLAEQSGRSVYGGTPSDASVMQAIAALKAGGQEVMFYPFVLMEQMAGNTLPDPYGGTSGQAVLPWRGRITLSVAPGRAGSPDRSAAAAAEVAAFFGTATPAQVQVVRGEVQHLGVTDWGYRRFILHYARLCELAGGVDSFCIGSELRGLTQIRGAGDSFPAVEALRALAADVRGILRPGTKISYAADWSEYWGHVADGNRYFHLDPLWADPNIDFIGIDNYMPLSDWRDGEGHADAAFGAIHDQGYLKANVAGGEGYDWYYDSVEGEAAQRRLPIRDEAEGEDWIWRYKDLKSWWSEPHHERIAGQRVETPTAWQPQSKPFWFTELGCAAIDKGTNQPNLFLDAKSSESSLPRASSGARDDLIQMQYLRAVHGFWGEAANNPVSDLYAGRMVDMAHAHVWAYDARPFPAFPNRGDLWSDGDNYDRGHWLNGRTASVPLDLVVREILQRAGVMEADTSRLYGAVRGYAETGAETPRAALQPLMLAHGFDCHERDGILHFVSRQTVPVATLDPAQLVEAEGAALEYLRASDAELPQEMRVLHVEAEGDYQVAVASAAQPASLGSVPQSADSDLPLVLTTTEARSIAEAALTTVRTARDSVRFALPLSCLGLGAGDVVALAGQRYRIDRTDLGGSLGVEAVRVDAPNPPRAIPLSRRPVSAAARAEAVLFPLFIDLPLLTGEEVAHAPHVAVAAEPWPGRVAVWASASSEGFALNTVLPAPAVIGQTETALPAFRPGVIDRAARLRVRLGAGELASASVESVLNGANLAAVGDGSAGNWELVQFTDATPISRDLWELSGFLRGQCGTDMAIPPVWPVGSLFVLVTPAMRQIALRDSEVGLARTYRIASALRGYTDGSAIQRTETFTGIGRRPYAVAHLRHGPGPLGPRFTWVRRTRIDGDGWRSVEVPLGEVNEAYAVQIWQGGLRKRETVVAAPFFDYPAAMVLADGVQGVYRLGVAQISESFGPGPFRWIDAVA